MSKRKRWPAAEKLRIVLAGMQPNVEVSELMAEQHQTDVGIDWIVEDRRSVMPLEQEGIFEDASGGRQHGNGDHDDQHIRRVKRNGATGKAKDQLLRWRWTSWLASHMPQGPTGKKYEQLSRVRQRNILVRESLVQHPRNVVDKNCHQREATPEVHGINPTRH